MCDASFRMGGNITRLSFLLTLKHLAKEKLNSLLPKDSVWLTVLM
jgi:hypothetical protein